ncbi:hypothetical protein KPL71_009226 [Citrus sinensis]|uniref:Uncharacterized protein n=1 Tax=Citrus sinensis TaxID=2711 RepID=A0ACB8MCB2_CITSI|nr:hypothetical protein KPL71_009226 [Citrus sinensis]
MDSHGYKTHVENGIMKIVKGALIFMKAEKIGANLFMLKGETVQEADTAQIDISMGGAKYMVTFIDDYSRRCWVYPIKKKSNVFPMFKEYKARVELESSKKIKCLRTDNGGEYTDNEFLAFCKQEGIQRQFTVAYTPQQNGVAERMNRTLTERIRAILRTADLPNSFWAEAAKTACYIVNRSSSTAIGLKTAMEMWTEKPADYSYLHAFGCPVYVMYNVQEKIKLDPKSRRCIFLGYADGVKGYRLWDPTTHKIIISRDVIFIEDQLQMRDEDDSMVKEKSETIPVYVENNSKDSDSFEAAPEHEEQEPVESEALEVRRSTRERRLPTWHSEYVTEINVVYCLLTEDGEPSTFREALNNSDVALWITTMQEEIEVYKIKRDGNDQVERYRARLVVKGYAQKEGIDFNEIFSPVVRLTTVRVVLAMCATFDLYLEQLDVKTAFLHGELEEEIYMLQPEGFTEIGKKNLVCRLNKSLYGLKQAPRCWYKRFDSFIMSLGYNRLSSDHCAYYKRPDIAQAVRAVSRYMANPGGEHWIDVKRILRYIKRTSDVALCYRGSEFTIRGYVDSDFVGDLDKRKSTTGYVFTLAGTAVNRVSKLQTVAALSTIEAEYMAATQVCKEAIWIQRLLKELGHKQEKISVFCDSQSALHIARNPIFHSRTKHIGVQYHFIREAVEDGSVDLQKIHTKENLADVLTKPINTNKFI